MDKVCNMKAKLKNQQPEIDLLFQKRESKEAPLNSEMDDIHLASYFQPCINFFYYILFVPFKIELTSAGPSKTYFIRTNPIQKFMCGVLHPIICMYAVLQFRSTFMGKVRQNPNIFMRGIDRANTILMCFVFFYTMWFKKDSVLTLCRHSIPSHKIKKVNRLVTFSWAVLLTCSISTYISDVFLIGANDYNIEYGFRKSVQKFRFQYYYTDKLETVGPHEELSALTIVGTTIAMLVRLYLWMLWDFVTSLNLMTGFVAYKVSKKFKSILIRHLDCTAEKDAEVFEAYSRTKIIFNKLDDFIGPISMAVFLITTTSSAVSVFDIMDSDGWIYPIIFTIYLVLSFFAMAFLAEAHYQASYFKTWLLDHPRRSVPRFLFKANQCNLAIKGNRFFTVTYSFLGTTISTVLTLTIIMIQFSGNLNPKPTSSPT